ncbi:putative leucine-rich repeat-containing protein DDB_G0290503 [Clarias gariepinus]|uniref:putative leucine-rich repeat-containing protein DDB_G0290503 n=1 Tax=Clarias gariepinus TaxID=13013 RepID=UPI00234D601F|nr:putative leucine-rich repeat-containing protein DDB_G0290503 [Clarias gariepinus]
MDKCMSVVHANVPKAQLRPLLYNNGTVAAATGFYFWVKRGDRSKTTAGPKDPVCDQATEAARVQPEEVPQYQDVVTETKEKIQKLVVFSSHLKDKVSELEELLSAARRDCDLKGKECERERESHSLLQAEMEQMKSNLMFEVEKLKKREELMWNLLSDAHMVHKGLKKECEREQVARMILQSELNEKTEKLKHCEELLMEYERERESHSLLQAEMDEMKSNLMNEVEKLEKRGELMWNLISDVYVVREVLEKECEQEREARNILQSELNEKTEKLKHCEKLLMDSLAKSEKKLQMSVETIAHLDAENSELEDLVMSLREAIEHMQNQLSESYREHDKLMNEREREAHSILQAEKDMMKTLTHNKELLKVSINELEEKHQKAVEMEKSRLDNQEKLCESQKEADNLTKECERERESHSILQSELNQAKDDFKYFEKNMTVSLPELKEKHQKAVENITQLETEKSALTDQVETLREAMEEIRNESRTKPLLLINQYCLTSINIYLLFILVLKKILF